MADVQIYRYRNDGSYNDTIYYYEGTHEEGLDGTDRLILKCKETPRKRAKFVWKDELGMWREHMVVSTVREHNSRKARTTVTCCNSVDELFLSQASGDVLKGTVQKILEKLLEGTRWTAGNCDQFQDDDGDNRFELEVWHKDVRSCITELVDMCGGEMQTGITVGDYGVTKRTVKIVEERGSGTVQRQFKFGRNMDNVKRTASSDEVYTAIVGYGKKKLEIELEKYSEELEKYSEELGAIDTDDMEDEERKELRKKREELRKKREELNEELRKARENPYLERLSVTVKSKADLGKWGVPGADGAMGHAWTTYTDDGCTDKAFLRRQCKELVKSYCKPLIRYEFDAYQVGDDAWKMTRLGSRVHVVDEKMDLDSIERISYVKRNLKGRDSCRIVIGKRVNPMVDKFKAEEKKERKSSGNSTRSSSKSTVTTKGSYTSRPATVPQGSSSVGYQSYSGATTGDKWVHQIDGVTQAIGTINFITTPSNSGGSSSSGSSSSSGDGWGGGDGDNPSSSGGGDF